MISFLWFAIGLVLGGCIGVVVAGLLAAAGRADERSGCK